MADRLGHPDFLIIGAGIAGVSLASELAVQGASVLVVEATQVCGGSSGLNAGGVRQQFSQPINITLARRTVQRLAHLRDDRGIDLSHRQVGYLFLISNADEIPALQTAISIQNSLDVPSRWLSADEIADVVPGVREEGMLGATFCPTDGYLNPNSLVTILADDARRAGARICSRTAVVGFNRTQKESVAAQLSTGESISAGTVVNCAGAWASAVASLYGASLPVQPWRSQCFHIEGVSDMPPDCPVTIDFDNCKTYFHADNPGFLAGTDADDGCEASWHVPSDYSKSEILVQRLTSRFSCFDHASIRGGWSGMLELTADENPICDWTHYGNVYTMAGFSGHGLAIAPGLAEEAATALLGGKPAVDLSPYRMDRFDGSDNAEPAEAMSMR